MAIKILRDFTKRMFNLFFKRKKEIALGFYGPPNAGKTSLANRICKDWTGEDIGKVSNISHETRQVQFKEEVEIKVEGDDLIIEAKTERKLPKFLSTHVKRTYIAEDIDPDSVDAKLENGLLNLEFTTMKKKSTKLISLA